MRLDSIKVLAYTKGMACLYRPFHPVHWSLITLSGPDAQDFLHRITTVDVRNLHPGEGADGFLLTGQGRILSVFSLWNTAPQEYLFELDAGPEGEWKREFLDAIEQYTFAEKISVEELNGASAWIFDSAIANLEPGQTILQGSVRLFHHGKTQFGRNWIVASALGEQGEDALTTWLSQSGVSALKTCPHEQLESWRIQNCRPALNSEVTMESIPLELGMLESFSKTKGCYPGQEVIERIIAHGSPARRLVRISGTGAVPSPGEKILNTAEVPAEMGEVTSISTFEQPQGQFTALAIVRKIHAKEGLDVRFSTHPDTLGKVTQVASYV